MKFRIPFTARFVYLRLKTYNLKTDLLLGQDSGPPFNSSHYLFLDYDTAFPTDFQQILEDNSLRQGIIVESSPGKYHALSFSPIAYDRMLKIMETSQCDRNHTRVTKLNGYSTIRVSLKGPHAPAFHSRLKNPAGSNFYNYDAETTYLNILSKQITLREVD